MISQENIEKLEQVGFPYIISLRPRNNKEAQSLYQKTLFGFDKETSLKGLLIKEFVQSYKNLQEIENAFREMKDFLKIRPIFPYSEEQVKAHVFICVLANLFEKLVGLYCQRANLPHTARGALSFSYRSSVKVEEVKVINSHFNFLTEQTFGKAFIRQD